MWSCWSWRGSGWAALYRAVRSRDWAEAAVPAGLCVAWLAFAGMTAVGRAEVVLTAGLYGASRYAHVGAALLLPVAALGPSDSRRHALLGAVALVPLAIGLPGNLDHLENTPGAFTVGKDAVLAIAESPYLDEVPARTRGP